MKKIFLLFALVGMNVLAYSQDVKVNVNNQDATVKDDCPYRINGICATEDIGGVEAEFSPRHGYGHWLQLTNYNNFPVNVLWKIDYTGTSDCEGKTGNIVLGVGGQKEISLYCSGADWSLSGLIVRKLAQQ